MRADEAMDLYRYLFAPALVAVAVLAGHHERRPPHPPEPPAVRAAGTLGGPGQGGLPGRGVTAPVELPAR